MVFGQHGSAFRADIASACPSTLALRDPREASVEAFSRALASLCATARSSRSQAELPARPAPKPSRPCGAPSSAPDVAETGLGRALRAFAATTTGRGRRGPDVAGPRRHKHTPWRGVRLGARANTPPRKEPDRNDHNSGTMMSLTSPHQGRGVFRLGGGEVGPTVRESPKQK